MKIIGLRMTTTTNTTTSPTELSTITFVEGGTFGAKIREFVTGILGDDYNVWSYVIVALFAVCVVLIFSHFVLILYKCFCKKRY